MASHTHTLLHVHPSLDQVAVAQYYRQPAVGTPDIGRFSQALCSHTGLILSLSLILTKAIPRAARVSLSRAGLLNVQLLSAELLDTQLLQHLLPPSWQGAAEVQRSQLQAVAPAASPSPGVDSTGAGAGAGMPAEAAAAAASAAATAAPLGVAAADSSQAEPSDQWLRLLWAWLADRSDVLQLGSWPLLPVQGGRLARLQQHSLVGGPACLLCL